MEIADTDMLIKYAEGIGPIVDHRHAADDLPPELCSDFLDSAIAPTKSLVLAVPVQTSVGKLQIR